MCTSNRSLLLCDMMIGEYLNHKHSILLIHIQLLHSCTVISLQCRVSCVVVVCSTYSPVPVCLVELISPSVSLPWDTGPATLPWTYSSHLRWGSVQQCHCRTYLSSSFHPQLGQYLDVFKDFYLRKHSGRKIQWQSSLGHCVLRAGFRHVRKQ